MMRLARLVALGIVVATLVVAGVVVRRRLAESGASEPITEPWDRIGGELWFKPGLRDARVVIPDRPHGSREFLREPGSPPMETRRQREFRLSTNQLRLRGPEVGAKEGPRVLVLGDSVAAGWGVDQEATLTARLAAELAGLGAPAEVINGAVPALGSQAMLRFCRQVAPELEPDVLLWVRRPPPGGQGLAGYADDPHTCADALPRARLLAVLAPLSSFDPLPRAGALAETEAVRLSLDHYRLPLVDLTPAFVAAQAGRGVLLRTDGQELVVEDPPSGRVLFRGPPVPGPDLPPAIYQLFEQDLALREPLFIDGAHPDAEGYALFAKELAKHVAPMLTGG